MDSAPPAVRINNLEAHNANVNLAGRDMYNIYPGRSEGSSSVSHMNML